MFANFNPLRISMQFFAADTGADAGGSSTGSQTGSTGSNEGNTNSTTQTGQNAATGNSEQNKSTPSLEALIQSAVDRATNKLGNENKRLQSQVEELMKQKLTDEERVELERKQERERFEQEKAQFLEEKNKLYAITALSKAELSVESDKLETLVSLVLGTDENAINQNVKALSDVVKALVASKVEQTFKENGRNPAGSGNADNKSKDEKTAVAEQLGKVRSEQQKRSREILDKFTRRN